NDIENNNLYGAYQNNILVGLVALVKEKDISYEEIKEGSWIEPASDNDLVIHRIAVKEGYHGCGVGSSLMKFALGYAHEKGCLSIKADTHEKNLAMQHLLLANGFSCRGKIYLKRNEKDNERLAFEKIQDEL
ncbi:MAG: GNAT family N-acetyltransferase, partial [Bacilli bacterium]|nr:GNAT family N-acetyltransferase [Bacilli bacterium]